VYSDDDDEDNDQCIQYDQCVLFSHLTQMSTTMTTPMTMTMTQAMTLSTTTIIVVSVQSVDSPHHWLTSH